MKDILVFIYVILDLLEHGHHAHYISILKTVLFISSRMLIKKKKKIFFKKKNILK